MPRQVRLGILLLVGLSTAFEAGCAGRAAPIRPTASAAALVPGSTSARDPIKKLREALEAAKRRGPVTRQQDTARTVPVDDEAPPESGAVSVGTSGGDVPALPTDSAPASELPPPPPSGPPPAEAQTPRLESRQLPYLAIGLAFAGTVLLLVVALFKEHHRHE